MRQFDVRDDDDPLASLADYLANAKKLSYGIYDLAKLERLRLPNPENGPSTKVAKHDLDATEAFLAAHPKAVWAAGYEAEQGWLVSAPPPRVGSLKDARVFKYDTVLLEGGMTPRDLLFVMDH